MNVEAQFTGPLGRAVYLRPGTSDRQVWADTFTGLYHVPPPPGPGRPAPTTVLDLGANIGLTAAHYARMWPSAQIVAVEMDDECCDMIDMNAPSVDLKMYAVSAHGGVGSYDPNGRAEAFAFSTDPALGKLAPSYTLRQIIFRCFEGGHVDFVKMDIEGEEWAIFQTGGWPELVGSLLVELHGEGGSEHLVRVAIEELTSHGFEARHHPPHPQAVYARRPS